MIVRDDLKDDPVALSGVKGSVGVVYWQDKILLASGAAHHGRLLTSSMVEQFHFKELVLGSIPRSIKSKSLSHLCVTRCLFPGEKNRAAIGRKLIEVIRKVS